MNAWHKRNEPSHEDNGTGGYASPSAPSKGAPDLGPTRSFSAVVSSRFRVRSKTLGALLYVAGALVLITLAVYSSGGWQSPLSVFYLFVVVICASYFSTGAAVLGVAVTLLANLAPQLYAPNATRMVECLAIQAPTYAGIVLACRYGMWERSRTQSERDSARIRDLEERLWHEASLDPLTGLYNRGRFEDRFEEEFERARRGGEWFMVLFVDVDDFKLVNDTNGHRVGDEALKLVADTLRSCSRRIDVVARHGGDEFLVMLPRASLPEARRFFERMRDQVAERSGRTLGIELRLSAGAVQGPGYAKDPASLLDAADEAMYRAKRRGKNRLFAALSLAPAKNRRTTSPEKWTCATCSQSNRARAGSPEVEDERDRQGLRAGGRDPA